MPVLTGHDNNTAESTERSGTFEKSDANQKKKDIFLDYLCTDARKAAFSKYPHGREIMNLLKEMKLWSGGNNDLCDICCSGGHILMCEFCNLVFHTACFYPPILEIPDGHWACPECSIQYDLLLESIKKKEENLQREAAIKRQDETRAREDEQKKMRIDENLEKLKAIVENIKQESITKEKEEKKKMMDERKRTMVEKKKTIEEKKKTLEENKRIMEEKKKLKEQKIKQREEEKQKIMQAKNKSMQKKDQVSMQRRIETKIKMNLQNKAPILKPCKMPVNGYKTELCMTYRIGRCKYGKECNFAHGPEEVIGSNKTESKVTSKYENEYFKRHPPQHRESDPVYPSPPARYNQEPHDPAYYNRYSSYGYQPSSREQMPPFFRPPSPYYRHPPPPINYQPNYGHQHPPPSVYAPYGGSIYDDRMRYAETIQERIKSDFLNEREINKASCKEDERNPESFDVYHVEEPKDSDQDNDDIKKQFDDIFHN